MTKKKKTENVCSFIYFDNISMIFLVPTNSKESINLRMNFWKLNLVSLADSKFTDHVRIKLTYR